MTVEEQVLTTVDSHLKQLDEDSHTHRVLTTLKNDLSSLLNSDKILYNCIKCNNILHKYCSECYNN